MSVPIRRRRLAAIALASVAMIATTSACGSDDEGSGSSNDPIKLVVDVFGDQGFGYDELYKQYEAEHPNVKIEQRGKGLGLGDYNTRLTQQITAGAGAGDVVALEEGTIVQFYAQAGKFVNLADHGANDLKSNYLPWKWEQGTTPDGTVLGLGTDVGSMALCYRSDLFKAAGLPTDREEVGALWPTWDQFIATGQKFVAADKKHKFVDSATNFYNVVLMQTAGNGSGYTYYDKSNKLVIGENPDVKTAYDLSTKMIAAGLSNNLQSFSNEWNAGFKNGTFATIACPAWMTGVIKGQAGDSAAGKWDVAKAPGNGGNWGGSFLAVPKSSKHAKEAAELVKFLTSAKGQIEAFKKVGNLPSSPQALADPAVADSTNEYFTNAPVGKIFAAGASELKPVYLGPKNQAVRTAVENTLRAVEQGKPAAEQWEAALKNGQAAGK
ncbi:MULTISPECIES: extracellular solute-binding protein [unclassified Micromonospora]|uniref:ABC transporter substrate-binding protein n=1 Tax=Micromonospora TaxID=1873 RepID=UPI002415A903|nr:MULTISPECIES: extracellular solute-binding protein [unclassified Micromonospora]MDG4818180.1 extracellular solute-binding protein [Micromonospora sp. WMMD956]WFE60739.1 extracellular solute-binding protein [Micromonospora sp. WMMD712]